jgi:hypothetical protein
MIPYPIKETMYTYTIYDHPSEFPNDFVVRRFTIVRTSPIPVPDETIFYKSHDLKEIRMKMYRMGLTRIVRDPSDPPRVLETWI